jgi:phosphoserine aminotransferase
VAEHTPAFPTPYTTRDGDHFSTDYEGGMSLRDYFASKALAAFICTAGNGTSFGTDFPETNLTYAKAAYVMADAMLEARGAQ